MRATLKPVPQDEQKPLDKQSIEEIIGRPAHQTAKRIVPHFPNEAVEAPRPNSVLKRLLELAKK